MPLSSSVRSRLLQRAATFAQVCSFIVLLFLPGCSGEAELPPDPHAFGRTIVSALKEADADAYEQLIYTKQDVEYMLDHRAAANRDDESYRKGWLDSYDRRREEIERSFDRIHREAERHGLSDWSNVTFKTVDFKTVREGDFTRYEMIVEVSTEDGREYVLTDATCWKTDRGLALQSPPTILTQKGRQGLGR
ncbi:hypothetical protein CRI94_00365 [Longibacter salinarum]|uniref:Uncharacterized protein n=1 Tax=Longibacter salinarum TaxID=1850348 RepID=A0A2A8D1L6_9BACT|nr:hypothetical protein [Longibacter salinarum]PEN14784.1 hypothetical protein CRI94_00365 [Longibacter salinarum]